MLSVRGAQQPVRSAGRAAVWHAAVSKINMKAIGTGSWSGTPALLTGPEEEESIRIWAKPLVLLGVMWIYLRSPGGRRALLIWLSWFIPPHQVTFSLQAFL